jgi:adenine deaminase
VPKNLTVSERKTLVEAALGRVPLDFVIDNVRVVNVYTGAIEDGSIWQASMQRCTSGSTNWWAACHRDAGQT